MRKTNILYRILLLAYTTSSFSEGIILPIYAIFVQRVGGDVLDAGFAMGIFLITDGIFTILIHRLNWNPKQRTMLMIIGWIVWIAGICMYLFISNLEMLFLTQFLTALGNAIANPIFDQELAEHVDKENSEFEWGLYSGSLSFLDGVAAICGGFIVSRFGFNVLIYLMILTAFLSFILILLYIKRRSTFTPI